MQGVCSTPKQQERMELKFHDIVLLNLRLSEYTEIPLMRAISDKM
jgi:hypothetical protein